MSSGKVNFKRFGPEDFEQLYAWLQEPHVRAWWDAETGKSELYRKYVSASAPTKLRYIIEINVKPAGFVQAYWTHAIGGGWWNNFDNETMGFDLFVGDKGKIGKGFGLKVICEFAAYVFEKFNPRLLIADPAPNNARMIHVLETAGFKNCGLIRTPDGEAQLFELEKSGFHMPKYL